MKRIIALTLFAALLCGQQAGVVFGNFTAPSGAVVTVTIGTSHCNFFAQLPAPGQAHIGCYTGAALLVNEVVDVTASDHDGTFTFGSGSVSWQFTPGTAPHFNYSIAGTVLPDPGMEQMESGTF